MKRTRRNHTAVFKAKVALAAIKGEKTLAERSTLVRNTQTSNAPEELKPFMDEWGKKFENLNPVEATVLAVILSRK